MADVPGRRSPYISRAGTAGSAELLYLRSATKDSQSTFHRSGTRDTAKSSVVGSTKSSRSNLSERRDGTESMLTGIEGATSLKEEICALMPAIDSAAGFRKVRHILKSSHGGAVTIGSELVFSGYVDAATYRLTTGERPHNALARLAAGVDGQPEGAEAEQAALGAHAERFLVCRNREEQDQYYDTGDPGRLGRVSMARRHRLLTARDLSWQWFNALVFGLVPPDMGGTGLPRALAEVEAMRAAAWHYVGRSDGWSDRVGLYFNVFGHNTVNALCLHVVDLSDVGQSFQFQSYRNCPLDDVLKVLREEVEQQSAPAPQVSGAAADEEAAAVWAAASQGPKRFFFACTGGATSLKSELVGRIPVLRDTSGYREARRLLREELGGAGAVREELERAGFVEASGSLAIGQRPFNVFAHIAAGSAEQPPGMAEEQRALGAFGDRFVVCANRAENDDHWDSADPAWVGRASMARRHRFITTRSLHWSWFNPLVFGLAEGAGGATVAEALRELEAMGEAAHHFAEAAGGWSKHVGLYFHIFGHNSVNSLHLHVVDLSETGPTFQKLAFKNCPLQAVVRVLREELAAAGNTASLAAQRAVAGQVQAAAKAAEAAARACKLAAVENRGGGDGWCKGGVVDINVGGRQVCIERDTLLQAPPGSVLHSLARDGAPQGGQHGGHPPPQQYDSDGVLYLDCPPRAFERIADHLRMLRWAAAAPSPRLAPAAPGPRPLPRRPVAAAPPGSLEAQEVRELADALGLAQLLSATGPSLRRRWCCCSRRGPP